MGGRFGEGRFSGDERQKVTILRELRSATSEIVNPIEVRKHFERGDKLLRLGVPLAEIKKAGFLGICDLCARIEETELRVSIFGALSGMFASENPVDSRNVSPTDFGGGG